MIKLAKRQTRRLLAYLVCVPLTLLANRSGLAEEVVFELNSHLSSVDLTAFGYVDNPFYFTGPSSTRDTQTIPLGGTLTLDVDVVGDIVQSVNFVALEFDYLAQLTDPVIHKRITLYDSVEDIPRGTEIEVHLPFNEALAAGNPVPRFAPTLTLNGSGGGTETGTGGDLGLTNPAFDFVGSGQYFNLPPDRDSVFVDGWPMDYGPYPTATPFPSMIPGTEYIGGDWPHTTMSPAPQGPNHLTGVVSVVGEALVFDGSLLSLGVGGAGILQTAQIHEATILASNVPFRSGDFDMDGDVDGMDFLQWQRDPSVGDLVDWQAGYGTSSTSLTANQAVPEPSTMILFGSCFCLAASRRSVAVVLQFSSLSHASKKGTI